METRVLRATALVCSPPHRQGLDEMLPGALPRRKPLLVFLFVFLPKAELLLAL